LSFSTWSDIIRKFAQVSGVAGKGFFVNETFVAFITKKLSLCSFRVVIINMDV
jgi:hypothetical protein